MQYCLLTAIAIFSANCLAQVSGCTDPLSTNYNPEATTNDGSCLYPVTSVQPQWSVGLPDDVRETSGLILYEGFLLTHNDSSDSSLYSLALPEVAVTAFLQTNLPNVDWEEIAQDEEYIYIGDFGNNSSGNRTDLKIYRIAKSSLNSEPVVETIAFVYGDQNSYTALAANTTEYDCEAFLVTSEKIYLFTKKWSSQTTSLYELSKHPGSHTATLVTTENVNGLITGAAYVEEKGLVTLTGYSSTLQPFIYLLYDFEDGHFFSGNRRKLSLQLPLHQVESITSDDGNIFFLTNEKFAWGASAGVPAKLHAVDLSEYTISAVSAGTLENVSVGGNPEFTVVNNHSQSLIHIRVKTEELCHISLVDVAGRVVATAGFVGAGDLDVSQHQSGLYYLKVGLGGKFKSVAVLVL